MEDILKSIDTALLNEQRERDFYLANAERTQNPLGKRMFATIAHDEEEHYQRLQQLHKEMTSAGTWPETIPAWVNDTDIAAVIADLPRLADKTAAADADDLKAIRTAIAFEEKGYAFYRGLRDSSPSPSAKVFFDSLAAIEREHLGSLKETLLFFEDPAAWYAEREKPHFEA